MAIPILKTWQNYFTDEPNEGLGSSYERIILNIKLDEIIQKYNCKSLLEVPIFGFTGVSGINSMHVAKSGLPVTLIDNDQSRLEMIKNVWEKSNLSANFRFQKDFKKIELPNESIDMSWNFSALWFVENLTVFLHELTRVTKNVIMLCVPNRSGIGYLSQKYISGTDLRKYLIEDNIIPKNIIAEMRKLNWKLVERNYIDCPPWPDIGMDKRDFLKIFHLDFLLKSKTEKIDEKICILKYYQDKDLDFAEQMMNYYWLEKIAPKFFKAFWAHHKFLIFERN
ncbi:MAG: methyltransferase domain-containing protein [Candidatus Cloacimonadota bacterium]|nr:methyltransferase domain-containing protein [Candidatus Cloacimonadota bacterium]